MKKQMIRAALAIAILAGLWSILAFAIPFAHSAEFWLGYVFAMAAIVIQMPVLWISFEKGNPKSRLYGFPIARVGLIYLLLQLVLSLAMMIFGASIPGWIFVVLQAFLLAAAGLGMLTTSAVREEIAEQDDKLRAQVSNMRELQSRAFALASQAPDGPLKEQLKRLSDDFRYSDPVSSDATLEQERELKILLDSMESALADDDTQGAGTLLKRAQNLLTERNRLCKLNK